MQDEPTPTELIKAVADFMRAEIAPQLLLERQHDRHVIGMISAGNKATRGEPVVGSGALQLQPREMVAQRYRQLRTKAFIRVR